jgi:hypothetical protein
MQARRTPQHVFMAPVWENEAPHISIQRRLHGSTAACRQRWAGVVHLRKLSRHGITRRYRRVELAKGDFRVEFAVVSEGFGQR